jgi:hypothetical protein
VRVTEDGSSPREGEDGGSGSDFTGADGSPVVSDGQDAEGEGDGACGLLEKENGERRGKEKWTVVVRPAFYSGAKEVGDGWRRMPRGSKGTWGAWP